MDTTAPSVCTHKLQFIPLQQQPDISKGHRRLQLWGRMRVHKGTTSGLWQSYLHITPEVKYWFSAKEHHNQERCAMLVKEPCTPRGMMGEHKGRGWKKKKKEAKSNNRSPVRQRGAKHGWQKQTSLKPAMKVRTSRTGGVNEVTLLLSVYYTVLIFI